MITEVFPTRVRGLGASIGSLSNWGFNTLVVWTFYKMASAIGNAKDVVVPEGTGSVGCLSQLCGKCILDLCSCGANWTGLGLFLYTGNQGCFT